MARTMPRIPKPPPGVIVLYDSDADVAYLSIGEPRRAVGEETPEGHVLLYDEETGDFCGLTLIGIRNEGFGPI